MARKRYEHSAYWYIRHNGWTYSEASTFTGEYWDLHTYKEKGSGEVCLDSTFNPLIFSAAIIMDIGLALHREVKRLADPVARERMKREFVRDLRILRRPFYYERETRRRRELAAARRKITRRTTTAEMPTPEAILDAWNKRKESREAMIVLGGLLHDLECYVDNCLKIDEYGNVVGRNGGIRGWLRECLPELSAKYKTLMRYKALAVRLRQATETKDPKPTSALLAAPRGARVAALLSDPAPVFSHLFAELERQLSPETVFLDAPKVRCPARVSPKEKPSVIASRATLKEGTPCASEIVAQKENLP